MKKQAIIADEAITQFIPQREPIIMVDKFFGIEGSCSFSGLTINPENIFCQAGELQEPGIIEHIAQSAALRVGYISTQKESPIPLGYIGSVDKLEIKYLPKIGSELFTSITLVQEIFNVSLIQARIEADGKLIAECRLKIFLQQDEV